MPMPSLRAGSSSGFGGADTYKLTSCFSWNTEIVNWLLVIICRNMPSPFTTISDLWVHFIIPSTSPAWRNWLYQALTWSPTRSFFKTSCGTLHPHPFRSVNLVNLQTTNMNLYQSCKVQVHVRFSCFWFVPTWSAINEWLHRTTFGKN